MPKRSQMIRLAASLPKGHQKRRSILAALKRGGRSDPPSPEIQKLNAEFYKKLVKEVHDAAKWTYLDDPKDGLALWIEEHRNDQKGLRALREEIISNLDSALKKLAPIARDIDDALNK